MATSDMDLLEAFDAAFARGQEQRKAAKLAAKAK